MRALRMTALALLGVAVLARTGTGEPAETSDAPAARIGVYDSRAIAVAAAGSEYYTQHIKPLEDAFRKAVSFR